MLRVVPTQLALYAASSICIPLLFEGLALPLPPALSSFVKPLFHPHFFGVLSAEAHVRDAGFAILAVLCWCMCSCGMLEFSH